MEAEKRATIAHSLPPSDYYAYLEQLHPDGTNTDLVTRFLDEVIANGSLNRAQVRQIVDSIARPDRLRALIHSILNDKQRLEALARKSFGHSTGMERIQLAVSGPYSLRLHFWMPTGGEPKTEDPHNHVYQFGAKVLSGGLVTNLYHVGHEGQEMNVYQIASQTTQTKPTPECIGVAQLSQLTPPEGLVLTASDEPYTMSDDVIHRVTQADPQIPIITLNLRGPAVRDKSHFFRSDTMQTASASPVAVDVEHRLGLLIRELG